MSGSDKALLDRLSALKGSGSPGASLDRSSNALNIPITGIEPAKPASREDALASRLRSLRNTPEREDHPPPQPRTGEVTANPHAGHREITGTRGKSAGLQPVSPPSNRWSHLKEAAVAAPTRPSSISPALSTTTASATTHAKTGDNDIDPLLQSDDQTLEDLLNDEDLLGNSGPQSRWRSEPKDESAKVTALLEELSKTSVVQKTRSQKRSGGEEEGAHDDHRDDESDGEKMSREVEILLSQALDEARLDLRPEEAPEPPTLNRSQATPGQEGHEGQKGPREVLQGDGDSELSLPSVPSTLAAPRACDDDDDDDEGALSLPSVPSGAPQRDAGSNFDNDIAARMAALSGPGSSSDGMGLPSAPTFQPADRAVKRLTSKTGYTDEDAETWCTVCLEDASLQCLGCEDVYCTRCWHEMHVGPAAAFDDQTHKAVRFVKPKKDSQRRVMLGAS
ncbi:hypothetical protein LX36DRAFT_41272 [Colletotrichum falcatum]|nr:hypothetical protein LX36DRAFT_41272 [Colletotrichum falcatum]